MKSLRPIAINFAPPSWYRVIARLRAPSVLLGVLGLGLCGSAVLITLDLNRIGNARALDLERDQQRISQRFAPKPTVPKFMLPEPQSRAINHAIAQLNLPWRDLLDALEAATPPGIALLDISPDAKKRILKGMAETKTSDEMIDYIKSLKQQPFFGEVLLTKHEINEQDPNRPLRFQFEAQWAGNSAADTRSAP